jgi:phospholipase/carboxylesterase
VTAPRGVLAAKPLQPQGQGDAARGLLEDTVCANLASYAGGASGEAEAGAGAPEPGPRRGGGEVSGLDFRERRPDGEAAGLLILHHGRGADENDLLPLGEALDPGRRLHLVTPAAPLMLADFPGRHWYLVPAVGHPDPETFRAAADALAALHDALWEHTGISPERTVLGGFSMGAVMSYALGLGSGRPRPAGILACSGFVPDVEGWELDLDSRAGLAVFIAHGRRDPVIGIEFGRSARALLSAAGLDISYHESDLGHQIESPQLAAALAWLPL